jgi:arylsulfatase A-like enzyme
MKRVADSDRYTMFSALPSAMLRSVREMEMAIFIYQQQEPGVYVIIKMTHLPCLILIWLTLCLQVMAALTNVVFIAVDDLRPELGCYGATHMKTPSMDRLAASGMLFERSYCQVAVCNPSRSSVLSGTRPDTTGVLDNQHFMRPNMPDVVTLPQHFKNHGYTSLSLGKVFHHSEKEPGNDPQSWSEPAWYHGEPYRHWFSKESLDYVKQLKALPKDKQPKQLRAAPFEAADEADDSYPDAQTALKAIETLKRLKADGKPFFLGVGFVKPHLPFTCPQKYWELYPADTIHLAANPSRPKSVPEPAFHNNYELCSYGTVPGNGIVSNEMALNLIRGYRACVSFMDAQLGRMLDELDRLGLRENTLVVLWGDHGYHLGENGVFTEMTNFEFGTRVPLIVSLPGMKTVGQRSRALVELVDLYPTLAELCALPLPKHLEGSSFAPLLEKPDKPWKKAAFSQYLRTGKPPYTGRSIRTDHWRYTEWHDLKQQPAGIELYDELNDPQETTNLAGEAAHMETIQQLATQLKIGWKASLP